MSSEGNPNLLDGIFREEDESRSSESEADESTPDMILRAVKTLGDKSGFVNKWIADGTKQFYYSGGKLVCYHDGKYSQYIGDGRYLPMDGSVGDDTVVVDQQVDRVAVEKAESATQEDKVSSSPGVCWVTAIPRESLTIVCRSTAAKRQRTDESGAVTSSATVPVSDLLEEAELTVPGISEFFSKWSLGSEESIVRHFMKLDRLLAVYIMKRFNPVKAKPKNALQGFIEHLSGKYPQKWRIPALVGSGLVDSEECSTVSVDETGLVLTSVDTDVDSETRKFELEGCDACNFQIIVLGGDFYVLNRRDGGDTVVVDGMRATAADGPVGPLRDGSVISVGNTGSIPNQLLVVEIGAETDLHARRIHS